MIASSDIQSSPGNPGSLNADEVGLRNCEPDFDFFRQNPISLGVSVGFIDISRLIWPNWAWQI